MANIMKEIAMKAGKYLVGRQELKLARKRELSNIEKKPKIA
jgi:hypothetical protein